MLSRESLLSELRSPASTCVLLRPLYSKALCARCFSREISRLILHRIMPLRGTENSQQHDMSYWTQCSVYKHQKDLFRSAWQVKLLQKHAEHVEFSAHLLFEFERNVKAIAGELFFLLRKVRLGGGHKTSWQVRSSGSPLVAHVPNTSTGVYSHFKFLTMFELCTKRRAGLSLSFS